MANGAPGGRYPSPLPGRKNIPLQTEKWLEVTRNKVKFLIYASIYKKEKS